MDGMNTTHEKIRAFIAKFFANVELEDDQDIFSLGFINSLFAMQLVVFVENECGSEVESEDLTIDNFRSINAIAHLIERKMTARLSL